jgi:hypothetical protein
MTSQPATQPVPVVHPLTIAVAQRVSSFSYLYRSTVEGAIEAVAYLTGTTITPEERATIRGQVALVLARCGWQLSQAELAEALSAAIAFGQAGI